MLLVSSDSKYLFSVNGVNILVYSILSGEVVYRLSYNSNKVKHGNNNVKTEYLINCICLNPLNRYQLLSFHQNGVVCLWDYEDGLFLKAQESNLIIKKVFQTKKNLYGVGYLKRNELTHVEMEEKDGQMWSLFKLVLIDNKFITNRGKINDLIQHQLIISNLDINKEKLQIFIDNNDSYVAYIEGRKKLVVNQFYPLNLVKKFKSKIELTCLALHPNEDCIATGTTSGKIILWYNYIAALLYNKDDVTSAKQESQVFKPTKNILHWHSLSVLSLSFTSEGSFLLSGGYECVLVKWMFKTSQKDFKPRLGAPINEVCCTNDNSLYITGHSDNTIHVIGTNFNVIQTLSSFLCPNFEFAARKNDLKSTLYPAGLNYFENLNCLITNGKPGHLQFYSFSTDKVLFNLDVVNENYISPENLNRPNVHTEIEHVALTNDCVWLATIERRDDSVTTPETRLKFWNFDKANKKFILNTLVRFPHSFEKVNSIRFKQNDYVLFSCGNDGCFKSWKLSTLDNAEENNRKIGSWTYNSCNGYREMSPNGISFNITNNKNWLDDLIAVSFNHTITLWRDEEFDGLIFNGELIHCDMTDNVKQFEQIPNNRLLAIHSKCINLWEFKQNEDQKDSMTSNLITICTWSLNIELYDSVLILEQSRLLNSQILLFLKTEYIEEEIKTTIKTTLFEMDNVDTEPKLSTAFIQQINSMGKLQFVSMLKNESTTQVLNSKDFSNFVDIFYCDNNGYIRLLDNEMETDLNESMWMSRKALTKKLPQNSLISNIIDIHKANQNVQVNSLIQQEDSCQLKVNLKKIENTPAYLMPKVSSFCYETLKSMLHKVNETNTNTINIS